MSELTRTPDLPLSQGDLVAIRDAHKALEKTSFAARISSLVGKPLEALRSAVPRSVSVRLDDAVERALERAMKTALASKPGSAPLSLNQVWFHRGLAAASGVAGGAFGMFGTILELPVATTLLLRQIAAEAAAQGEDLRAPGAAAECLQVFALGGRGPGDDAAETGYFAVRLALAETLKNAVGTNLMPSFISAVAIRFGGPVALKFGAQAAPILGAAAGAAINLAFLDHFRGIARAHFTLRRLERNHGREAIRAAYVAIEAEQDARFAG